MSDNRHGGGNAPTGFELFEAGDIVLQAGMSLKGAQIAFKTFGALNSDGTNAILYPTWFSGQHDGNTWLIGAGKALDPNRYFIVIPNLLGNGLSTSPSNAAQPYDRARYPLVSLYDNVRVQHKLLTEHLGVKRLALVTGWSMAAQQTFQWGALYPDMVERIAPFCGSARTSRGNAAFLEAARAALTADAAWHSGWYEKPPTVGLRAMARVFAGSATSQAFYRAGLERELGFHSLEDFLIGFWEAMIVARDANDLLAALATWQSADISANEVFSGDLDAALSAITARAILMPSRTDAFFPPEDSEGEVARMPNSKLAIIPSDWGHLAGGGVNPGDARFIDDALKGLLGL